MLCESNNDLSNCAKCNFNVCNVSLILILIYNEISVSNIIFISLYYFQRCIEIHEIEKISNGVVTKCFGCQPHMLWKQRAKTANVLKIFSSQL